MAKEGRAAFEAPAEAEAPVRTADEQQEVQVKRLSDDERAKLDRTAAEVRRGELKDAQAVRLKGDVEAKKAQADWLYVGSQRVEMVRDAEPGDVGYEAGEAQSVVKILDTDVERLVRDKDISVWPRQF